MPEDAAHGVRCPSCGCPHAPVIYTRHGLGRTFRRRECRACGRRFGTTEHVVGDGSRDAKSTDM